MFDPGRPGRPLSKNHSIKMYSSKNKKMITKNTSSAFIGNCGARTVSKKGTKCCIRNKEKKIFGKKFRKKEGRVTVEGVSDVIYPDIKIRLTSK